ncbi:tyrosine-protein phosphatase [Xanthocytophaga flava]|uniref:tyrosine-protein phosphatase n=1 Tax=Xanthocytophaga flava TaxID=3048013 RepID=UPI0028D8546A|nr:tyrosine-protein phosphatase [Xanthocytophaga flavus]MDJ1470305.1 tyrosine-protein phosphatase [Xanthocytophaga flavus]
MKLKNTIVLWALLVSLPNVYAQSLKIEQVKENTFHVWVNPKSKISWNTQPDVWKNARALPLKSSEQVVELAAIHPILKEETGKTKSMYAAPRAIMLQGAANFRDLGGYLTQDGKQVKWGKMYRSADISHLTDSDLKTLSALQIQMVCDLRGEQEAASAPDRLPEGTERILLPTGSENITGNTGDFMRKIKTVESADSMMTTFYTRTDHLGRKYKPVFEQLLSLETNKALMFHCTAGKDRTGVGAALILYALGVDEPTIIADYEATNIYRKESNERYIQAMVGQGLAEPVARTMMAAKKEYLLAAFDAIKKHYGSVDTFLVQEIGLTPEKRALLQSRFLY